MSEVVLVALISGICTAIPSLIATFVMNNKTMEVLKYRIESLEAKTEKHNNVVERTFKLEEDVKNAQYRINDLKNDIDSIRNN
jgi:uncharacterized protein YoxC|nr:MAG TPA: hemolysin [Caudoviricetes sp.]